MKKTYITPASDIVTLNPQQMLAGSIKIVSNTESMDAANAYSSERGWSSDIWTDEE